MITVNNYTDKANSINWSKLPKALQDTKEDIDFSIELYDDLDKGSKDVIDLFLKQLNKNLSNTDDKKPTVPPIEDARKQTPENGAILMQQTINGTKIALIQKGSRVQFVIDGKAKDIGEASVMEKKFKDHKKLLKSNAEETKKTAAPKLVSKFKIGQDVKVKNAYLGKNPTFKQYNHGVVRDIERKDGKLYYLVEALQDKGHHLFIEKELIVLKPNQKPSKPKKKQKASTKKESPCDEAIQNFLEDQKEDREKAAAKRKRNKVKNALDQETVNFYNAEFRLLRRFYNLVSKKTKVSFRSVQLLYMAFQKNAVARKVRKTSDLANLYNICNKKLTKLYEAIAPEKADVKITFKDKDVLEQLATLVKNKKVDYSISLINRIINMQGTAPEDAKVKRLISSIDNAIKKGKIDERSRLFDDIKKGKSTLKAYLEDKTEKIPTKQYGLSKPNIQKKKSKKKGLGNPKPKTIEVDLSQVPDPTPKALGNPYTEVQPQPQTEALHLERSKPQSVNTQKEVVKTDAALQNTASKVIGLKSSKEQRENAKPINYFALNGTIAKFLGNLEKKHKESLSINISGPAGSMKTRFSFQFVDELLTDGLTVGFASLEEHYQSALFRNKEDQYIKPQNLDRFYPFSDLPDTFEQFVAIVNQCDAFFTDSWQKLVEKYGNINYDSQFRKAIDGKILFTIFQETTDGKTRGGSKTTFDGDIILKVDVTPEDYTNNYVYAQKNRYETIPGAKYYIHDKKLVTPQDEAAAQLPQSIEVSLS